MAIDWCCVVCSSIPLSCIANERVVGFLGGIFVCFLFIFFLLVVWFFPFFCTQSYLYTIISSDEIVQVNTFDM